MKTKQKLLILFCAFLISILSSCIANVHESAFTQPKMSFTEATNSIKEAIKDTKQLGDSKVVADVAISAKGITLFYNNNTPKYFAFNDIKDPIVQEDNTFNMNKIAVYFDKSNWKNADDLYFNNSKSAKMFADALYYLKHHDIKQELAQEQEDCLRLVRQTPIDLILAGTTADRLQLPCSGMPQAQVEASLNEELVEWKNQGLGMRLQKSSPAQLNDMVTKMEKGILKLDLKSKDLKDAADAEARQVTASGYAAPAKKAPGALSLAHLLDQRKTILMVILGSVKQAAAQRASGG